MGGRGAYSAVYALRARPVDSVVVYSLDGRFSVSNEPMAIYEKPREALTDNERAGVDHLLDNGHIVTVLKEDSSAAANIDLSIDGNMYELKNVTNTSSSVGNQIGRAREKWHKLGLKKPVRMILTTENARDTFDELVESARGKKRDDEVIVMISSDGREVWI